MTSLKKPCTICGGKLKYGNPEKDCFRCNGTGAVSAEWEEPANPPLEKIREIARRVGYAIAEHGSQTRDFDLIAIPWTADAPDMRDLLQLLCKELNARILDRNRKPHDRRSFILQMDGYIKHIDLSIMPIVRTNLTPASSR